MDVDVELSGALEGEPPGHEFSVACPTRAKASFDVTPSCVPNHEALAVCVCGAVCKERTTKGPCLLEITAFVTGRGCVRLLRPRAVWVSVCRR